MRVYEDHDTHPLTLDLYTTKLFGPEWIEWEPEALRAAIWQEVKQWGVRGRLSCRCCWLS